MPSRESAAAEPAARAGPGPRGVTTSGCTVAARDRAGPRGSRRQVARVVARAGLAPWVTDVRVHGSRRGQGWPPWVTTSGARVVARVVARDAGAGRAGPGGPACRRSRVGSHRRFEQSQLEGHDAAWVRSAARSFQMMFWTCFLTVSSGDRKAAAYLLVGEAFATRAGHRAREASGRTVCAAGEPSTRGASSLIARASRRKLRLHGQLTVGNV